MVHQISKHTTYHASMGKKNLDGNRRPSSNQKVLTLAVLCDVSCFLVTSCSGGRLVYVLEQYA
eukprot:scaffold12153_cov167-Amphora_coffeaeformis.AAC.4